MKKSLDFILTTLILVLLISCGTNKVTILPEKTPSVEPFSTREYFSDDQYYRASSSAYGSNESVAHARAKDNALAELISETQALVERITSGSNIEKEEGESSFNSSDYILKITTYVRKNIPNPRTIGKTITKEENGKFKAYRALEVKKSDIIDMLKNISEEDLKTLEITKQEHSKMIENIKIID